MGKAWQAWQAWHERVRFGQARLSEAGLGKAGRDHKGQAWPGKAGNGEARTGKAGALRRIHTKAYIHEHSDQNHWNDTAIDAQPATRGSRR